MVESEVVWQPYEPTENEPWDLRKVAHLHRRAGFGANWHELMRDLDAGPAESIGRFLDVGEVSVAFRQVTEAMWRSAGGDEEADGYPPASDARRGAEWWLYRMAYGDDALGEKLTLFWHGHFATGLRGVYSMPLMLRQNETLRRNARGHFGEMLEAIEQDPAMLIWLDGGRNQKERPNENFARELLELFTLGVGNFTEGDVKAAARSLTGWSANRNDLLQRTKAFTYKEDLADAEPKSFLGQTGRWKTPDIFRILLQQRMTAMHICRRLYAWLVDETAQPADEIIAPLAAEYRASNYSTQHVVGIMLRSKLFFSRAAYRRRVKSPVEFCIGVIRALEPPRSANLLGLTARACERQGQALFDPPSVKGWDGGQAWLNSNTTLMRLNWTAELIGGNSQASLPRYDVKTWFDAHPPGALDAPARLCELLVDGDISQNMTDQVKSLWDAGDPNSRLAAIQVLLQSPEYQLA